MKYAIGKSDLMKLQKDAFESSSNFIDTNFRQKWEDNIRHFQSLHHSQSKYYKNSYKYRSKIFRPKTRSVVRANEAAAMQAFFSNEDVVSIDPVNSDDPAQVASAAVLKEILNIRLTNDKYIPWFKTLIGGVQDSETIGIVISRQDWDYSERVVEKYEIEDDEGNKSIEEITEAIKDSPSINLIPIENLRISPTASWIDPIGTSPYLIEIMPMHLVDVKTKMINGEWKEHADTEICSASYQAYDTTKQVRNAEAIEASEMDTNALEVKEYDLVYVHRNIFRIGNDDYVFYTIGTELKLTDPELLEDGRLYVIGVAVIEAHRLFPDSLVRLGFPLQTETNEVANQRSDNVKLVLNKRWKVRRGAEVDVTSLLRNVPGGVTLMDDPNSDVVGESFEDITGSAYMEQDRLNVDFDELMGAFSASTVQTNRKLNETVGGMSMIRGNANTMGEYQLRTLAETWVEPVMRQLVYLEQKYETDEMLMAVAAQKARLFQKYGIDKVTDALLNQDLTTTVNVGMGATDPMMKLGRLLNAMDTLARVINEFANVPPQFNVGIKVDEVAKEVFAQLGYKDGKRFVEILDSNNPALQKMKMAMEAMQQQMQELQKQLADKQAATQAKLVNTQMKEEGETKRLLLENDSEMKREQLRIAGNIAAEKIRQTGNITQSVINLQGRSSNAR